MGESHVSTDTVDENARKQFHEGIEMTLMGWIRTSITLIGFGFALGEAFSLVRTGKPGSLVDTPREYLINTVAFLHVLKSQGYGVVEEAATEVIAREQRRGNLEPHLRPDFIDAIVRLQKHRQLEAAMAPSDPQWYDRSPVCTLALSRYLGYPPSASLLEELESIERERMY